MVSKVAHIGDFCLNPAYADYGRHPSPGAKKNIKKTGHTKQGRQRYQCTICGRTSTQIVGKLL